MHRLSTTLAPKVNKRGAIMVQQVNAIKPTQINRNVQTSRASKRSPGGSGSWGLHVLTRLEPLILQGEAFPWSVCCLLC